MRILSCIAPLLLGVAGVFGQVKTAEKPINYKYSGSLQAVVVTTDNWDAIKGEARLMQRSTVRSQWKQVGKSFPVVVGRTGLAWSIDARMKAETQPHKVEGDGKAPAGILMLTSVFASAEQKVKLPFTLLKESTECVDDTKSVHYNKIVDRFQVGVFDWKSSEKMLAVGPQYELGVFVAHNSERRRGSGSCIFLHIWENSESGTAGCTAMERKDLERITSWLDPAKKPFLIQMPLPVYKGWEKVWRLPKLK